MIGKELSHFEITAKLGEGGMGAVYRATDTKLDREVAIKVLPDAFISDAERLARFEREAKVLATLNHPNIAGIYEVDEALAEDGTEIHFLAMELAEGEDLAERLGRGPMGVDEVVAVGLQIAAALEAAHDRGVVHRDLKPANIKLATAAGETTVKVLDFGLAKAWDDPTESNPQLTQSPTLTAQMTQAGVILGTAGYMSPEQARAQEADRRSDIWSFGVVLHEMLTGQRLFSADTVSDTLARVLTFEPEWAALESAVPKPLIDLLRRCLDRDLSQRLQAIGEARIALETIQRGEAEQAHAAGEDRRRSGWWPWTVAAAAIVAALAAVVGGLGPSREPAPLLQASINVPEGVRIEPSFGMALSPDGKHLVTAGATTGLGSASSRTVDRATRTASLWLRPIDSLAMRPIPGTEGGIYPFWSPDSRHIGFFAQGKLKRVDLDGSPSLALADVLDARGGTWSDDDVIVYAPDFRGGLWSVSATGGEPQQIASLDVGRGEQSLRWPWFLPGGEHLLFLAQTAEGGVGGDDSRIESLDLATGERTAVLDANSSVAYDGTGHLLYWDAGALVAQSFDVGPRQVRAGVLPLVEDVGYTQNEEAVIGISSNGMLAYQIGQRGGRNSPLGWYDRQGNRLGEAGQEAVYIHMSLSPDGTQVAYSPRDGIWILDVTRGTATKFTEEGDFATPIWSEDGEWLAYRTHRDGPSEIRRRPTSGLGEEELLWSGDFVVDLEDWSSDGSRMLISMQSPTSVWDIGVLDIASGEIRPVASTVSAEFDGRFSPDDEWIVYNSDESGNFEVYMVRTDGRGRRVQLSTTGGDLPYFSPSGREVTYTSTDGWLYSVSFDIDPASGRLSVGMPERLFDIGYIASDDRWHLGAADGERFLVREFSTQDLQLPLYLVQNWTQIIERRR